MTFLNLSRNDFYIKLNFEAIQENRSEDKVKGVALKSFVQTSENSIVVSFIKNSSKNLCVSHRYSRLNSRAILRISSLDNVIARFLGRTFV